MSTASSKISSIMVFGCRLSPTTNVVDFCLVLP
jgi:hypothetical protein